MTMSDVSKNTPDSLVAKSVIETERKALQALGETLDDAAFTTAIDTILGAGGYTIVAGVGKSGHIGNKIAASLASTGTPSFFLHPTEASHGDLGMISQGSVILALSYSGESRELVDLLQYARANAVPVIAMTRSKDSTLGRLADVVLLLPIVPEACPNGLAPTSSTTMSLALGDALTIALMERRGFSREDFGHRHPGGKLGRSLQTAGGYVANLNEDIPVVVEDTPITDLMTAISEGRKGCVAVLDTGGRMVGMVTDGDLRRAFVSGVLSGNARDVMTTSPRTIDPPTRMSAVIEMLTSHRISNAFVVVDGKPIGIIDMKDLLAEGYL